MLEKDIDKSIIFVESRSRKDSLLLGSSEEEKKFSQRVMVALYINLPRDLDGDGVDRDLNV